MISYEFSETTNLSFDEDLFFKEIEISNEDEDLIEILDINLDLLEECSQIKILTAMKKLKSLLLENSTICNKNQALGKRLKENFESREKDWSKITELTDRLKSMEKKYKESIEENKFLRGESKFLSKLELSSLLDYEKTLLGALSNISEFKNKKITDLSEKIEVHKKDNEASKKCIICSEKPISIMINPCKHVCLCSVCALRVTDCPLDRNKIISCTEIFLAI